MPQFEVIPLTQRTTQQPHPHVTGHYIESTHVDMWAVRHIQTKEVVSKHWHKESCESVARWYEQEKGVRGAHPCSDVTQE